MRVQGSLLSAVVARCFVALMLAACTSALDVERGRAGGTAFAARESDGPRLDVDAGCGDELAPGALRIETTEGPIMGKQVGVTREFLGVPYGKAARFSPPMAADSWSDTRDATQFGPSCPQPRSSLASMGVQSEDCLSVNVYAPGEAAGHLPVIVFIHGGAFVTGGSSQYDGKILSESGVVVVTFNYRLGALGFLSLPALDETRDGAPSGSDGLRDQQLALHWVQDNIAAFGGDRTVLSTGA
jgi:para-nitrobenzyl esterase